MEEKMMITLVADMQFSEERLGEIFDVPKTKTLFDQFMQKEENAKIIKKFNDLLESAWISEDDGEEMLMLKQLKDGIIMNVKVYILAEAIPKMINGKSLNQAVYATLKEQMKDATVLDKVKARVAEILMIKQGLIGFLDLIE